MADRADPYLLLNAALQMFTRAPADLDAEQLGQATQMAEKESLLQQAILASKEAAHAGEVDGGELAGAIQEIAGRYENHQDYLDDLARNGLDEATLGDCLYRSLKMEKILACVASQAEQVSDEAVEDFYQRHPEKFERPELREARHIMITINTQFPENRRKAVRARMQKIIVELEAQPDAFADLAMRHSECPTALEGGELGKLPRGKLYPELDRMLFAMGEGEVSGIIESPMGMHVLRCDRIHPAGIAPLEEAAPSIREHLQQPLMRAVQRQWIKGLFKA